MNNSKFSEVTNTKKNGIYSFRKLLAFSIAFAIIGASIATVAANSMMVIQAEIGTPRQPTDPSVGILVWTDKATYAPQEFMTISVANPLEVRVDFAEDSYGLRIEKLVDGKWLKILPIYNPATAETSTLPSITESHGQSGEATVTYQLGADLASGFYRVVSEGKAMINGTEMYAEGMSEFQIITSLP